MDITLSNVGSQIVSLANLEITDPLTNKMIGIVCVIAATLAGICFVCSLGYNYFKSSLENIFNPDEPSKFPDYMKIAKGILFLVMISMYPLLAVALSGTIEFFNKFSSPTFSQTEKLSTLAEEYNNMIGLSYDDFEKNALESARKGETGDGDDQVAAENLLDAGSNADPDKASAPAETNSSGSIFSRIYNMLDPLTWTSLAVQAICHLLFSIVRTVISIIAALVFKFLLIVGPLAIAFSILPVFEKQISIWFGTLLNTGFVFTTLNILDHISYSMFSYILSGGPRGTVFSNEVVIFDTVLLIVYLSAFWLTSKYVGKGDGGKILSKMVAVGTAAALVMTGGASAAAGGGNLSNVISAAENTKKN